MPDRPSRMLAWRGMFLTILGITLAVAATVAAVAGLSYGLIERASAGQAAYVLPYPPSRVSGEVPEPPPLRPLRLSVRAINISWVTACADGKKVLERLFKTGDKIEIPFSETAVLRAGNAGGLDVTLAGQSFASMGQWGEIRMLRATPEGIDYVAPSLTDPCTR